MFSNHARLKKHTPVNGIDRKEYIGLLVDEFYETNDIGMIRTQLLHVKLTNKFCVNFLLQKHKSK